MFLKSICFPLTQSELFSSFQEIFKMSDALIAFSYNTALDLFKISFLSFLRLGMNEEGRDTRLVYNLTSSIEMLIPFLPQFF